MRVSYAKLARAVMEEHRERIGWQSARALALPLIGESLLAAQDGESVPPFALDGSVSMAEVDGVTWRFSLSEGPRPGWVTIEALRRDG